MGFVGGHYKGVMEKRSMNNKMVFTDNNLVVLLRGSNISSILAVDLIKHLESHLKNQSDGVYYNPRNKTFFILYSGYEYEVFLTDNDENELGFNRYTPLVKNLLYLAAQKKKIEEEESAKVVKETKIDAMEKSNYEDIEDIDDLRLYLDYLYKVSLKKARSREEKETVQAKIVGVRLLIKRKERQSENRILSPIDLKTYVERFVSDTTKRVNKLKRNEKLMILNKTKKIVEEYKKYNDINLGIKAGIFTNPYIALSILDKVDEIEAFFKSKSDDMETNDNELTQIMSELEGFVDKQHTGVR